MQTVSVICETIINSVLDDNDCARCSQIKLFDREHCITVVLVTRVNEALRMR